MTVRHLARYNINNMEYLLSKVRPLYKPFTPIEIRKGHYVIDIPMKETIIGHVNGKRNVLNFNFWAVIFSGLCCCSVGGILDVDNNTPALSCGGPPALMGHIAYGSGTTPASFSQYNLVQGCGSIGVQSTIGTLSDRTRITLYGTLPSNISCQIAELGVFGYDAYYWPFYYSRILASASPGTTIPYYIDFLEPWLQNFAYMQYQFFTGNSVTGIIDVSGNAHTFGGIASQATLIGSVNSYSWSPTMYSITQNVVFGTSHYVSNAQTSVVDYILGTASPSSNIEIYTLGLLQTLNPVSGSSYQAFILILPLSSPITLYANQQNTVSLRLVAE